MSDKPRKVLFSADYIEAFPPIYSCRQPVDLDQLRADLLTCTPCLSQGGSEIPLTDGMCLRFLGGVDYSCVVRQTPQGFVLEDE